MRISKEVMPWGISMLSLWFWYEKLVLSDWRVRQCMIVLKLKLLSFNDQRAEKYSKALLYWLCAAPKALQNLNIWKGYFFNYFFNMVVACFSLTLTVCLAHFSAYYTCCQDVMQTFQWGCYWKMGQTQNQTLKPQSRSKGAKLLLILQTNKELFYWRVIMGQN